MRSSRCGPKARLTVRRHSRAAGAAARRGGRRLRRNAQRQGFAFARWKIGGGDINGFGDAFIDQVDDELAAGMNVVGGILGRAVGVVLQAEHAQHGVL
jgi:hypothetical protein